MSYSIWVGGRVKMSEEAFEAVIEKMDKDIIEGFGGIEYLEDDGVVYFEGDLNWGFPSYHDFEALAHLLAEHKDLDSVDHLTFVGEEREDNCCRAFIKRGKVEIVDMDYPRPKPEFLLDASLEDIKRYYPNLEEELAGLEKLAQRVRSLKEEK